VETSRLPAEPFICFEDRPFAYIMREMEMKNGKLPESPNIFPFYMHVTSFTAREIGKRGHFLPTSCDFNVCD
jgi:hypothetical protein